ncbi:MAG: Ppx/GppA family phosphatase [Acidimicrobiia bacterium]|nr:Ppx/GppA family phosphatase [Acidimicrobiia bacterium]
MNVAAIDIGTNSMRLLVLSSDRVEVCRMTRVTGLGTGVDVTGRFDQGRVAATLCVMEEFADVLAATGVESTAVVATSATRDAIDGPSFVASVTSILGVEPRVISGIEEAGLAFTGATSGMGDGSTLVIDIGGGSTEFIVGSTSVEASVSVDIGSVRLTDRWLPERPSTSERIDAATEAVGAMFAGALRDIHLPPGSDGRAVGVAGTFTSLAAIAAGLGSYDRSVVDRMEVTVDDVTSIIERLTPMSLDETAAIPSLHPARAPVMLAGAVVASCALRAVGADRALVRESDLLDALAWSLLPTDR